MIYNHVSYSWTRSSASGKQKEKIKSTRARSAIVVVGMDVLGRIFVVDAWADRAGTNTIVDNFVNMSIKWGVQIAGFEDVAQQSLLIDPILNKCDELGVEIPLAPITVNTRVEKKWRIRTLLQPVIGAGRLIIREDLVELKNEITSFPMNVRMDLVDALATAVSLTPPVKSVQTQYDERQELARYLRESGMSPSQISRELGVDSEDPGWVRDLRERVGVDFLG